MNNKLRSKTPVRVIIFRVFVVLLLVLAAVIVSYQVRRSKLSSSIAKIQIGDTKESVVQTLGQPAEVEACFERSSSNDKSQPCVQTYWYKSFLERWGLSFNAEGKVIDKTYNVLY